MIGRLRGRVLEVESDHLVLDVSGVGYELHCSSSTLSDAEGALGELTLWVHTHVREDALQLYGFSSGLEKQLFLSLLKVNGVGPKMAMAVLSAASPSVIAGLIEAGDVRGLTQLPKVGKKTAEQIILSLRGKLADKMDMVRGPAQVVRAPRDEVVSALVHLGFRLPDVEAVVAKIPEEVGVEEAVRMGLRSLSHL